MFEDLQLQLYSNHQQTNCCVNMKDWDTNVKILETKY